MQNTMTRRHLCASDANGHCGACVSEAFADKRIAREDRADVARAKPAHGRSKADLSALRSDPRGLFAVALLWIARGVAQVSIISPESPDSPLRGRWVVEKSAAREMTRREGLLPYAVAEGFAKAATRRLSDASGIPIQVRPQRRKA